MTVVVAKPEMPFACMEEEECQAAVLSAGAAAVFSLICSIATCVATKVWRSAKFGSIPGKPKSQEQVGEQGTDAVRFGVEKRDSDSRLHLVISIVKDNLLRHNTGMNVLNTGETARLQAQARFVDVERGITNSVAESESASQRADLEVSIVDIEPAPAQKPAGGL